MVEVLKPLPGTVAWQKAMANANIADKGFKPQAKRTKLSKADIAKIRKAMSDEYRRGLV